MRKSLDGTWLLNGRFLLEKQINNLKVTVPGSIYNDLLVNKLISDPFYRANEAKMLSIMEDDYAYSRTFKINRSELKKELNLVFKGLDTVTEIYVNDALVEKTFNMHRSYIININEYAKEGINELKVIIKSPLAFIRNEFKKNTHELMNMDYAVKGYATIRKAHCMFGWDWGPQMPDGGIWRSVFLEVLDKGRIDDVLVYQDTCSSLSKLQIKINNYLIKDGLKIKLSLSKGDYFVSLEEDAKSQNIFNIEVANPKLWYPVGYGKQELYDLDIELFSDKGAVDKRCERIGLRKLEIIQEDDEYGRSFTPTVNGIKVFIKGSDYIIEDNILIRATINHTKWLIDAALSANQNTLRVWGGALYPSDEFYNYCDEKGVLIWQDLMFACGYYNMENESFVSEIKEEIIENAKRIHNHPCLLLICGNNENETAALDWNIPSAEYTKKWYLYQYEELIPSLLQKDCYDIFYWPSSPSSGGGFFLPNSDKYGDMHYWGVWHNNEPIENYMLYYPRMLSEFGMQSFPPYKTIKEFTVEEDRNIYSYVMERHQKNRSANQKIMNYIGSMFKYPKNLEFISYVSELIQAEAVKFCVEHLRRNYPRCMGAIYWQLNDCWPVASWSSIDYFGRYKALQYYSKKFYSKALVSIVLDNEARVDYTVKEGKQNISVFVTNEYDKKLEGKMRLVISSFSGVFLREIVNDYVVDAFSAREVMKIDSRLSLDTQTKTFIKVEIFDKNGSKIGENDSCFLKDKYLTLSKPKITKKLDRINDLYYLTLTSDTFTKYVYLDLKKEDVIFSDNYFNLMAGEEKVITFKSKKEVKLSDIKIINLVDSY